MVFCLENIEPLIKFLYYYWSDWNLLTELNRKCDAAQANIDGSLQEKAELIDYKVNWNILAHNNN